MTENRVSDYRENGRRDDEIHLREVWNLLLRRWKVVLGSVAAVVLLTAAYSFWAVPVYEGATSIRIEEERSDVAVLDILQSLSRGSEVETEMEVLRSRTLAEEVVDSLGLQLQMDAPRGTARSELIRGIRVDRAAGDTQIGVESGRDGMLRVSDEESGELLAEVPPGEPVTLEGVGFTVTPAASEHEKVELRVLPFEKAVQRVRDAVTVSRPNREAGVVVVRFESSDTLLVHAVPNSLARKFIARRQQIQKTEATSTVRFLEQQIDTLRRQLIAAEDTLQEFREDEQVIALEAEASSQVEQLSRLQAERNQLAAERDALQALVEEIRDEDEVRNPAEESPWRRLISFPSLFRNQATTELLRSLNELDQQRGELLQRRTAQDPDVQNLTQRIREQELQLRNVALTYLQGLSNQVRSLDNTLRSFGTDLERIPGKEVRLARLQRQTNVLEEIYTLLQTRLKEAQIAQAVEDPSVRVVDPAILPAEPIKPRTMLNLVLALVLGGMLGVGTAFTREYLDDTVHTREDLQGATGGVPVLGLIPRIRTSTGNGRPDRRERMPADFGVDEEVAHLEQRLVAGRDPRNPVSEAYRNLRTNITFSRAEEPPKSLVFTSPLPRDGKSTSASNLAITLAQQGLGVVLMDADLRRGVLHSVFGKEREPGLSNVLLKRSSLEETVQRVDLGESGSLDFIPTGTLPPNPAELLGSSRMQELLDELEDRYEVIIIDSPPLNVVTDAAVLGTKTDGLILVARASSTESGALRYAVEQLANVGVTALGTVLNDVDFRRDGRYYSYGSYGYHYQYYYGDRAEAGR